jgi:hypothetical protein
VRPYLEKNPSQKGMVVMTKTKNKKVKINKQINNPCLVKKKIKEWWSGSGGVAQGLDSEFKPSITKKKKKEQEWTNGICITLISLKAFCTAKNYQNQETAHRMEENLCKLFIRKRITIWNI